MPKITIIATGGTIASLRGPDGAAAPTLTATALVATVPQLAALAEIGTIQFRQVASSDLGLADIIALALEIERAVADGADGIVVAQGTDTLEETSFALDLLWSGDAPVIVTGAMRNPATPGGDGPANLAAATSVATSPLARGLGVLVVFNNEIHLPLHVRKTHATSTATFRSPLTGPIGWVVEGRTRIALRPPARHHVRMPTVPKMIPPSPCSSSGSARKACCCPRSHRSATVAPSWRHSAAAMFPARLWRRWLNSRPRCRWCWHRALGWARVCK